jgi:amidase
MPRPSRNDPPFRCSAVGVTFFASAWSEPALIRLAYDFEQTTRARKPPKFLATAEIATTAK